jgi:cytochrome b pre-mRNA-processing protein 3
MFESIKDMLAPSDMQSQVARTYITLVEQARKPFFYQHMGVPDTIDGRFELITLHMFLMLYRLKQEEDRAQYEEFNRILIEYLFDDMDQSLREMGVGDTGVGKRIKQMANALYGRLSHYEKGIEGEENLREVLTRNVYGTTTVNQDRLSQLEIYLQTNLVLLKQQDAAAILSGEITFFNPMFDDSLTDA